MLPDVGFIHQTLSLDMGARARQAGLGHGAKNQRIETEMLTPGGVRAAMATRSLRLIHRVVLNASRRGLRQLTVNKYPSIGTSVAYMFARASPTRHCRNAHRQIGNCGLTNKINNVIAAASLFRLRRGQTLNGERARLIGAPFPRCGQRRSYTAAFDLHDNLSRVLIAPSIQGCSSSWKPGVCVTS